MFIAVGIAAVALVIIVIVVAFGCAGGTNDKGGTAGEGASSSAPASGVKLAHSYTTQWPSYTKMTYPSFTFQYPDGWEIASENVSSSSEEVVLRKTGAKDVSVTFNFSPDMSFATPGHFEPLSITKVADSGFWPSYIQDTNMSGLGPFMVASVVGNWYLHKSDGMNQVEYYAVLPQSAQQTGFPGCKAVGPYVCFDYLACVSFQSSNVHDMDDVTRKEAIAILASFSDGSNGQNYEDALSQSNSRYLGVAYIFPDSDTRYLSESELNNRDFYDLYLARNEIFARHGRQFAKQELQDYFNGKSWYQGTIPPEQFDESVLNDYEKKNSALIREVEKRRHSPYVL